MPDLDISCEGINMTLQIEGMTCGHCKMAVEKALKSVSGVTDVQVSLEKKSAEINGSGFDEQSLIEAVENAGFKAGL